MLQFKKTLKQHLALNGFEASRVEILVEAQPGVERSRNIALDCCASDILAFLDDDVIADPLCLETLVDIFSRKGDRAGAVGGKVRPIMCDSRSMGGDPNANANWTFRQPGHTSFVFSKTRF
jgi:GT2 family glycosyltransferase